LLCEEDFVEVMKSDEVDVESEDVMFKALQKWVRWEVGRNDRFPDLLKFVRMQHLSGDFLTNVVAVEPLIWNIACAELMQEAIASHAAPQSLRSTQPPRLYYAPSVVIGDTAGVLWRQEKTGWKRIEGIPQAHLSNHGCVVPGGFVVSGGINSKNESMCDVYKFNASKREWTTLPPMSVKRNQHSSVFLKGSLYVIGGYDNGSYISSVERLDLASLQWSKLTPMPEGLCHPYVAAASGKIYVLGGFCASGFSRSSYEWNGVKWTRVASLSESSVALVAAPFLKAKSTSSVAQNACAIILTSISGTFCSYLE
jgi:hypothetical protein